MKDVKLEIQAAQDKLDKNYTQTHHNLLKTKEKEKENLNRIQRKKQYITYKGKTIQIIIAFSSEIMKFSNYQTKILYSIKILSRNASKIKTLSNGGNLRKFLSTRHVLKETLKGCSSSTGREKHRGNLEIGKEERIVLFCYVFSHKDAKAS